MGSVYSASVRRGFPGAGQGFIDWSYERAAGMPEPSEEALESILHPKPCQHPLLLRLGPAVGGAEELVRTAYTRGTPLRCAFIRT